MEKYKLGEIFVAHKLLSGPTVERVVKIAAKRNKKFGFVLEEMGLVTGVELANALAEQHGLKTIDNFADVVFPAQLLDLVPAEVALANMIFPLKIVESKLALAIVDPTNTRIIDNIAENKKLSIVPFVTTRNEIHKAICRHYFEMSYKESEPRTLLLADDNKVSLDRLSKVLACDYVIHTAMDGMEAYKIALVKKPRAILVDKEMPKFNGYQLLNALKNFPETKTIPTILISGNSSIHEEVKAFESGFFDFIHKTTDPNILLARVKRAFEFHERKNYLFA